MISVYFVRHAEPDHNWIEDRTRPLTEEGIQDSDKVLNFFKGKQIHAFFSSPYTRSLDTIKPIAEYFGKKIKTDERFRERKAGDSSNNWEMIKKRWDDLNFHELGGESIKNVQERNIEALHEILVENKDINIVIGTHGTALSSIINYYDSKFIITDFLRIINFMPYIIRMKFKGENLINKEELFYVEKEFKKT